MRFCRICKKCFGGNYLKTTNQSEFYCMPLFFSSVFKNLLIRIFFYIVTIFTNMLKFLCLLRLLLFDQKTVTKSNIVKYYNFYIF